MKEINNSWSKSVAKLREKTSDLFVHKRQKQANTPQEWAKIFSRTAREGILRISKIGLGCRMPGHIN